MSAARHPAQLINYALDHPVGNRSLSDFAGVRSASIAISDKTRPVPHGYLLPPLLQRLENLGLPPESVTLFIASGAHPKMSANEFPSIVPPEILARYQVISHDIENLENLVYLGRTKRGTPVWINRHFIQADLRLVVGNIEPHQFMGFSGGVKSAVIGLAGKETIKHNHTMMIDPQSRLGYFEENPARQDVEEIGRIVGVHFALNTILNENKKIVEVIAGKPETVMLKGIPLVRQFNQVYIPHRFDLVIASPGGYPKDINLYQSQKGLAHAALITKDGGTIILAAACPEGSGSDKYEQWMEGMTSYEDIFNRFKQEGFRIGPHKAFQIARNAARARTFLISDMPSGFVRQMLLTPAAGIDQALAQTLPLLPADARIAVLSRAASIIPRFRLGKRD